MFEQPKRGICTKKEGERREALPSWLPPEKSLNIFVAKWFPLPFSSNHVWPLNGWGKEGGGENAYRWANETASGNGQIYPWKRKEEVERGTGNLRRGRREEKRHWRKETKKKLQPRFSTKSLTIFWQ